MTVAELCKTLGCSAEDGASSMDAEVTGCYCCDLLSRAMAGMPKGSAWITVIGNGNAVAVAVLTGASCILLAEGVKPDRAASERAKQKGIAILKSDRTAYELAVAVHDALSDERP